MSNLVQRLSIAALAAVTVLLAAPAADAKVICGGAAGDTCSKDQYCFHSKGTCRKHGAQGACKQRPDVCTKEYRPVCGCDGKTYGNACAAAAAGVSVLKDGKCIGGLKAPAARPGLEPAPRPLPELPGLGKTCGGIAGLPCGRGEYCRFKTGECRIPDMQGVCKRRPRACTRDYRPVCGCDGKTYPNACTAASAGVSILYKGKCRRGRPRLKRRR